MTIVTPPQQLIALTPTQLTEVCVQFASEMGWIGRPGGTEWYVRMKRHGDPEAFYLSMSAATKAAVRRAAVGNNTEIDSLREFRAAWEAANG
jgi:hypothetical protein